MNSRAQRRHQRHRQKRRAGHREGFGERQRMKQFSFLPVSANTGTNARMMMTIAKKIGRPTCVRRFERDLQ